MTSSDAVLMIRRMLPKGAKTGHGGTLDPDAAGVLPICVGKAARLFDYIIDKEKRYVAELTLGAVTDTQDASGRVLERHPVTATADDVRAALPRFTGEILQTPPMYSALKRDGKRLCDLARAGENAHVLPRPVTVLALDYLGQADYNRYMIGVLCKKGVYVRTLMHDIGQTLGCGGHMSFLLRSASGAFDVGDAVTRETLMETGPLAHLLPPDTPLARYPAACYDASYEAAARNGNPLPALLPFEAGEIVRVYIEDRFAGMGEVTDAEKIRFRAMLL